MGERDLHIDYETRSEVDLTEVGLHRYLTHPSTQVILCGYVFGESKVQVWQPHLKPNIPSDLEDALNDFSVVKHAWNAGMEQLASKYILGIDVPTCEWRDEMVHARYLSCPGALADVSEIMGLKEDQAKSKEGKRLIELFCMPQIQGGGEGLFGAIPTSFFDWNTHPQDWELFVDYVKLDVVAERAIGRKMRKYPLPEWEQKMWEIDQRINTRGLNCDIEVAQGAKYIANIEAAHLKEKLKILTGMDNPNSNEQMLNWLRTEGGYTFSSLGKPFVKRAMEGECELTDAAREALEIRKMTSKTSVNKFDAILKNVGSDGRLRHQFSFMGAPRTGRWSGRGLSGGSGVQLQNLSKPSKAVEKNMDLALDLIRAKDYEGIVKNFGQPLEVASSVVRGAFRAEEGKTLLICDLNAIEARVLFWLSRCSAGLNVFRNNLDPYLDFATELYGDTYENLLAEYEAGDKTKRTHSKPGVLGCGYQLGGGEEKILDNGDKVKTGLLGYSLALGIEMTQEEADLAVKAYRRKYKEVPEYWKALEEASLGVIRGHGPQTVGQVTFDCIGKSMMRVLLPSGRYLHYIKPEIEKMEMTYDGRTFIKDVVSYMGLEQQTRQWHRQHTRGGHLTENICQAVARDILANGIMLAEEKGMDVVAHVHDEVVVEVDEAVFSVEDLRQAMIALPNWAEGLPLDASGFSSKYYRKD